MLLFIAEYDISTIEKQCFHVSMDHEVIYLCLKTKSVIIQVLSQLGINTENLLIAFDDTENSP